MSSPIQPISTVGSGTLPTPIPPIPGFNAPSNFPSSNINLGDPIAGISNQLDTFDQGTIAQAAGTGGGNSNSVLQGVFSTLNNLTGSTPVPGQPTSGIGAGLGGASSSTSSTSSLLGLSLGRVGAFLMGLILIAGGIYLFGRPQINAAIGQASRAAI